MIEMGLMVLEQSLWTCYFYLCRVSCVASCSGFSARHRNRAAVLRGYVRGGTPRAEQPRRRSVAARLYGRPAGDTGRILLFGGPAADAVRASRSALPLQAAVGAQDAEGVDGEEAAPVQFGGG